MVSRLPVYLVSLALILVVREQGGSYPQAGLVSALYTVGMALGSPLIAPTNGPGRPQNRPAHHRARLSGSTRHPWRGRRTL
ncbi:hypothetical protein E4K10_46230 [Streptomyces sp. T1317-0309]|nr:hypothetical protein E4K10_46230 [Streptomyces sp. T1317-0309]